MKGYCKCGTVIDEVQFSQFGACEKCYVEDEEREKRFKRKMESMNRCKKVCKFRDSPYCYKIDGLNKLFCYEFEADFSLMEVV